MGVVVTKSWVVRKFRVAVGLTISLGGRSWGKLLLLKYLLIISVSEGGLHNPTPHFCHSYLIDPLDNDIDFFYLNSDLILSFFNFSFLSFPIP